VRVRSDEVTEAELEQLPGAQLGRSVVAAEGGPAPGQAPARCSLRAAR
jgi:hypothetical protein